MTDEGRRHAEIASVDYTENREHRARFLVTAYSRLQGEVADTIVFAEIASEAGIPDNDLTKIVRQCLQHGFIKQVPVGWRHGRFTDLGMEAAKGELREMDSSTQRSLMINNSVHNSGTLHAGSIQQGHANTRVEEKVVSLTEIRDLLEQIRRDKDKLDLTDKSRDFLDEQVKVVEDELDTNEPNRNTIVAALRSIGGLVVGPALKILVERVIGAAVEQW